MLAPAMQITSKKSLGLGVLWAALSVLFFIIAAQPHTSNGSKFTDRMTGLVWAGVAIFEFFRAFRARPAKETEIQS
jgi:hypothetical protein